jgi:hypothetical protein
VACLTVATDIGEEILGFATREGHVEQLHCFLSSCGPRASSAGGGCWYASHIILLYHYSINKVTSKGLLVKLQEFLENLLNNRPFDESEKSPIVTILGTEGGRRRFVRTLRTIMKQVGCYLYTALLWGLVLLTC